MNAQAVSRAESGSSMQSRALEEHRVQAERLVTLVNDLSTVGNIPSLLMILLGSFVLISSLIAKIKYNVSPTEFITLVVAGTFLILCGALLRLYEFRRASRMVEDYQRIGNELVIGLIRTADCLLIERRNQAFQSSCLPSHRCKNRGRRSHRVLRVA